MTDATPPPDPPLEAGHAEARLASERRSLARHACSREAVCESIRGNTLISSHAVIHELSEQGMALRLGACWEPGTVVTVRLPTAVEHVAFTKLGHVVHVRAEEPGQWVVGVLFLQPLRSEEVEWLRSPEIQQASTLYFEI